MNPTTVTSHMPMAHGNPRLHVHQRQLPCGPEGSADGELRHAVLITAAVVMHGLIILPAVGDPSLSTGGEMTFHKKKAFHDLTVHYLTRMWAG